MTKVVFGGEFSMTGGGTMTKENLTLEETILHCSDCKADTMHIYKGTKEQGGNRLAFAYECRVCKRKYLSDRRF